MKKENIEKLLGQKQDYLEDMIDASPSCLKVIDKDGHLLSMNCRGLNLIESPDLDSVLGADVYEIVHPDFRKRFKEFNERVCGGYQGSLRFKIIGLEGTERWMETYAAPYLLANGDTAHIAITNDISESVLQEELLEEQEKLLLKSSKLAELGKLSGNIAHELNNPLMIITGNARQIIRNIKDERTTKEDLVHYASKIQETVDRMSKIIQGLKNFSHESKESDTRIISLKEIVEDSIALFEEKFKTLGIQFNIGGIEEDYFIMACPIQISQVLINLINNSFDAIEGQESSWIKIQLEKNKDHSVNILVSDSGPGISREHQDEIMTPFFTTKQVGKGTGLGLSISHGIIKAYGGELSYNENSPFTQFIIKLPLHREIKAV